MTEYNFPSMKNIICATCLSNDRKLYPVVSCEMLFQFYSAIWPDIKMLESDDKICWECRSIVNKLMLFKKRVLQAQDILSTVKLFQQSLSIRCLSGLTTSPLQSTCIGVDCVIENRENDVKSTTIKTEDTNLLDVQDSIIVENIELKLEDEIDFYEKDPFLPADTWHTQNGTSDDDNTNLKEISLKIKKESLAPFKPVPLTEEEMWNYREQSVNLLKRDRALYKCVQCIETFGCKSSYENHMLQHTQEAGELICNVCQIRFKEKEVLEKHVKHHYMLYKCKKCRFSGDMNAVRLHCAQKHAQTKPKREQNLKHKNCEVCGVKYKSEELFKLHKHDNAGNPYYECNACHKKFNTTSRIKEHIRAHEHRNNLEAFCVDCGIHFKSKFIYWAHLRKTLKHVKADEFKHKCPHCEKRFPLRNIMRTHVRAVHELAAEFLCKPCDKRYYSRAGLSRHNNNVHKGRETPRNKVCDVCGKAFKSNEVLKQHKNIHLGLKPFVCPQCPAAFSAHGSLFTHVQLVHKKQKKDRQTRDRTHKDGVKKEGKHQCPHCDRRFLRYKILENHVNAKHKRSLDFTCDYCNKMFYCDGTLQQHLRKHVQHGATRRPLRDKICDVCGKAFVTNAVLNQHRNIHMGVRPFACDSCPATFNAAGSLYNHVAVVHKKTKTWRKRSRPGKNSLLVNEEQVSDLT